MSGESPLQSRAAQSWLKLVRRGLALCLWWIATAWWHLFRGKRHYNVLTVELGGSLGAREDPRQLKGVLKGPASDFLTLLAVLKWARDDPKLKLVRITIGRVEAGWAALDEFRRSLAALRGAGKIVWVHLIEPGIKEYYLAAAASRLLLVPPALLDITGIATEVTFIKGALEKLGVEAQITQVGRYKALGEIFTREEMSTYHREMVESIVGDLYEQVASGIAASRELDASSVERLIEGGPYTAQRALELKLVDELAYEDEIEDLMRKRLGDPQAIDLGSYRRQRGLEMRRKLLETDAPRIALVELDGPLKMGESIPGSDRVRATGARSFARELEAIREADEIKGVVVRVNSPGGSGIASDLMWRELMKLKERKPVVVSFGEVAASGGYYVGMAANRLFAEGTTITGSIGVLAGKAVLRRFYDQLGITKEIVSRGGNPARHSDYLPLDEESAARILAEAEHFYRDFVSKVALCRNISLEEAADKAQGRVWSGRQAVQHRLVDEVGGVEQAIERVKELARVPSQARVAVDRFPRPVRLIGLQLNLNPAPGLVGPLLKGSQAAGWLAEAFISWWRGEAILALASVFPALGFSWGERPATAFRGLHLLNRALASVLRRPAGAPLTF